MFTVGSLMHCERSIKLLVVKLWDRRTVQKSSHDPDNHDGVVTHLEPDILECEVKWALGSITMNKASGGDGIPVELSQLPGESQGRGSLVGCRLWGRAESDMLVVMLPKAHLTSHSRMSGSRSVITPS